MRIAATDVEGANTLRPVNLMSGQAQQVNLKRFDGDRDLPDRLRRIGVQQYAALLAQLADRGDRVERANFVVGEHHADQDRPRRDRLGNLLDGDPAIAIHG